MTALHRALTIFLAVPLFAALFAVVWVLRATEPRKDRT